MTARVGAWGPPHSRGCSKLYVLGLGTHCLIMPGCCTLTVLCLMWQYVGEPDRLVNTPLRISPAIPVASQTAVKSDVTSSTAGPDNLTQLIVDADKVDEELRKAGEALYKEVCTLWMILGVFSSPVLLQAIVRTQGRPISLGLFQALSQGSRPWFPCIFLGKSCETTIYAGFLQGALRSAVASSKRLRRRLQAPPALDKPAAFPIVRPASPEQTPARQPVPSEGNASAVQGWDA